MDGADVSVDAVGVPVFSRYETSPMPIRFFRWYYLTCSRISMDRMRRSYLLARNVVPLDYSAEEC